MGRLFGLILVTAIVVPFLAAAQQVDQDRRVRLADLMAARPSPMHQAVCLPASESCGDQDPDD